MLDTATKKRIDDCRDILVGKVPDPKSQVEQITIALIYKFMDDMDAEAEELGGHRRFFAGPFARFGWAKLMAPSLGGFEVLALYSEAIQNMRANPGVPELFRDIFKNAYLPYRDPETLKSFLKEINHFSYDHSERLGDAFEYLLSVLGSQGDAGQFRTPRHIIDFMVAVIDPQKHETILDPACGTAGFLISAWKHILAANTSGEKATPGTEFDKNGQNGDSKEAIEFKREKGDLLSPDERKRLAANIKGYDISPDMVRLSLANLYLHGFADPHVVEYDTLTQDDKWNELADVILANPPFMSPKGGIKPHKRFSVQATRSEVLFVDYMAEHLSATGRAAIVVPEGIIFQSGTAYKALRKMLVESSLVAVVSLPAGVFNPYSGVKTSILILDKRIHKQTSQVLFVKVQNDGYNLGAQRRAVVNSDLPEATRLLRRWMTAPNAFEGDTPLAQAVERARIGEGGDFGLSGERYVVSKNSTSSFPMVELGSVLTFVSSGATPKGGSETYLSDGVLFIRSQNILSGSCDFSDAVFISEATHKEMSRSQVRRFDVFLNITGASIGRSAVMNLDCLANVNQHVALLRPNETLLPVFLSHYLNSERGQRQIRSMQGGASREALNYSQIRQLKIPLPPLEVQHQIVAEIEGYQKVIDGARQVVDSYKPHIAIDPAWATVSVGEVTRIRSGGTPDRSNPDYWGGDIPWVKTGQIDFKRIESAEEFITQAGLENSAARMVPAGTILMAMYGQGVTRGRVAILGIDATTNQACAAIEVTADLLDKEFLYWSLVGKYEELRAVSEARGGNQSNLNAQLIRDVQIPLPDLETQRAIVAEIEAEQALVNANRELIRRMEAKIKTAIDRVWGNGGA
jgi:type I restriction enzyme M protein